ncbi:hypothetical protein E2P81_ATG07766 [Venturia nashicola]|uniref:Uncharacterized protein n=1 Tax=Venturia nashicola TaxID=86259 RepID=A0A4Z1NRA3_9PEZI|nr:hypothetical protein E6O75_ATG07935 [Venturia nashicola]TLD22573.1 hypothetical protein E2P81_ATG07766 [Venturia nashicola]
MGGRLSVPRGVGLTESSRPTRPPFNLSGRSLTAPLAAFTMACILFVYARSSIHAARLNAQRHREADRGQVNWRNESMRRHGLLEKLDERKLIQEDFLGDKGDSAAEAAAVASSENSAISKGQAKDEPARALEDFKRRQSAGIPRDDD